MLSGRRFVGCQGTTDLLHGTCDTVCRSLSDSPLHCQSMTVCRCRGSVSKAPSVAIWNKTKLRLNVPFTSWFLHSTSAFLKGEKNERRSKCKQLLDEGSKELSIGRGSILKYR